ncbi:MAG: hypothetical protein F7C81_04115 [Desulfurococcales archaeon]|nr:hypothetical protein [Desulfurococcales archaeon]
MARGLREEDLPEDVIEDLMEASKKRKLERRMKEKLPSSRDVVEAVVEAASMATGLSPDEFPDLVYKILEEKGFSTRYVNERRIWSTYENLVRRAVIKDVLGVVNW